ncbi:copper-binding protein [Casimicrobium huifangae]|uniref:copper-binding protein n=1 Tax=Casimicrobium huifangae TaxID=2591109 RepID=UPI003783F600
MKLKNISPLLLALLTAAALISNSHAADDAKVADKSGKAIVSHTAIGVVKKLDAKSGSVVLAHEPVKSIDWPSMTMAFKVKNPTLFDKLTEGKKIEFVFTQQGRDYVVEAVK